MHKKIKKILNPMQIWNFANQTYPDCSDCSESVWYLLWLTMVSFFLASSSSLSMRRTSARALICWVEKKYKFWLLMSKVMRLIHKAWLSKVFTKAIAAVTKWTWDKQKAINWSLSVLASYVILACLNKMVQKCSFFLYIFFQKLFS